MSEYVLRLTRDTFAPGARTATPLPPLNRVLYVLAGEIHVASTTGDAAQQTVAADRAWYGGGSCTVEAGPQCATVLRYELLRGESAPASPTEGEVTVQPLLEHPIDLDPAQPYLMRCDRVDFAPGAVALPHGHKGGGIRCLVAGRLEVSVGDRPARAMYPGDAWFESGREPVLAVASPELPTSFVRVSILPRAIKGQSSIVYVNPEDARRSTPRSYTVHVDEPIEIV